MISSQSLKYFSDKLQRFPLLWKIAVSVYGFKKFSAEKIRYSVKAQDVNIFEENSKKYNLVFDAQCLQTLTRQRGIGNYSLNLISSICHERPTEKFAAFLTTIASKPDLFLAQQVLAELVCPNLDILIFDPFRDKAILNLPKAQFRIKKILESTGCKAVLSLSSFEKPTSVIPLPKSANYSQVGILYDLIKLQYPESLLISRTQKTGYAWALRHFQNFDLLLSISNESKECWMRQVQSHSKIEVIYGGGNSDIADRHKGFAARSGVLCVGAEQPHKNLERLLTAYSLLPLAIQVQHQLTIVGVRSIGARAYLLKRASKFEGTVNIPGYLETRDLVALYENARLLVMPSLVEGLSLPILEAWSHGLVAIGSSKTVAQELIGNSSLLFDPYDEQSMSDCIKNLLSSKEAWNHGLTDLTSRSELFTWSSTAKLALDAIERVIRDSA